MSLQRCAILLQTVSVGSDEVFEELVGRFDGMVRRCVAMQCVSIAISLTNMTHNVIDSIFLPPSRNVLGCRLSSVCLDLLVSFVDGLVWCMFVVSLSNLFNDGVSCSINIVF